MKAHELRDLTVAELKTRMIEEQDAVLKLRFNRAIAGQVENPAKYRLHKREIARIHTVITEKAGS